jgi:hypothetical protein
MRAEAPLPALLSQAFVALTIEVDNEAERSVPHTTTSFGATGEPQSAWLTSLAMWSNCLRGLADAGALTVAQLEHRCRMSTNLDGMRRWGYITVDGVGRVARGAPRPHANAGSVLALTRRGCEAEAIWRPLPAVVERRWRDRFGNGAVDELRAALLAVARRALTSRPSASSNGPPSVCTIPQLISPRNSVPSRLIPHVSPANRSRCSPVKNRDRFRA